MKKSILFLVMAMAAVFFAGCATAPQKAEKLPSVFYPEPPDPPRLQFLVSYTGAKDLSPERSAFRSFVTGEKEDENRLDKPYGVALYNGKIYVCDTNHTVMVFDLVKKTFAPMQGAQGIGKLIQPLNISIDAEGNKYVSDVVRGQVVVFDKNDFFVTTYGTPGNWRPVDAVAYGDRVYVADIKNAVIDVFDKKTGEIVKKFGQTGEAKERLYLPTNIDFDNQGILYVADAGKFQILKYDRDGHFRGSIGKLGTSPGDFARPRGVATDREDRLYAVDAAFDNVQVFSNTGQLLLFFGKAGRGPGDMYLPAKVAVDYDNVKYFEQYADPHFQIDYLVVVVNQFGNRMVNVYGFGQQKGVKYPSDAELIKQAEERAQKAKQEQAEKEKAEKEQAEKEKASSGEEKGKK